MKYILITLLSLIGTLNAADYQPSLLKFLETHDGYTKEEVPSNQSLATECYTRTLGDVTYIIYAKNGQIISYTVKINTRDINPQDARQAVSSALIEIFPDDHFSISQSSSSTSGENAQFIFDIRDKVLYEKAANEAKIIAEQKQNKLVEELKNKLRP